MRVLVSVVLPAILASAAWGPPPASDGIAEALAKIKGQPIPQGRAVTQGNTPQVTATVATAPLPATPSVTSAIEEDSAESTHDSLHPIGDDAAVGASSKPAALEVSEEEKIPSVEAAPGFDMNAGSSTMNGEEQQGDNSQAAVASAAAGADGINPGFSYLGASCGSSNLSATVFASEFFFQAVNYNGKDAEGVEPRTLVNACMKKCEVAQTKDTQLPCTGVHFDEEGNCKLHFMEMDVAASSVSFLSANKPYGCYRRADVPSFQTPGYALIGAAACESSYKKLYATVATEFNAPWSPVDMMSYCSKICDRNQDCVGFTASETCKVLMGSMRSAPSEMEKTYLQKPFGCYRKLGEGEEVLAEAEEAAPEDPKEEVEEVEEAAVGSPGPTQAEAAAVGRIDIGKEESATVGVEEVAKPESSAVETTAEAQQEEVGEETSVHATTSTEDLEAQKPNESITPTSAIEEHEEAQEASATTAATENDTATNDAAEETTKEVVNLEEVPAKTTPAAISDIYPNVQALF
eukprot:jgi/Bigna1/138921/aug1.47_g13629